MSQSAADAHDSAAIAHQVATLEAARLPLPSGLRALADEAPNARLARSLRSLADDIENGRSLDDALGRAQSGLAQVGPRALLEAGRRTHQSVPLLARTMGDAGLSADLRRRIRLGLVYPALLTGLAVALMLALLGMILSGFYNVFADFGVSLNWLSAELLGLGHRLSEINPWYFLSVPAAVLILVLMHRFLFTPAERRRLALSLPIFGPVGRYALLADFCRILSDLLDARLPLPEAITLAGEATDDPLLADACQTAAEKVAAGDELDSILAADPLFPAGFATFLSWARKVPEPSQASPPCRQHLRGPRPHPGPVRHHLPEAARLGPGELVGRDRRRRADRAHGPAIEESGVLNDPSGPTQPPIPPQADWMTGLGSDDADGPRPPFWHPLRRWRGAIVGVTLLAILQVSWVRLGGPWPALAIVGALLLLILTGPALVARSRDRRTQIVALAAGLGIGELAWPWMGPAAAVAAAALGWAAFRFRVWRFKIRHLMVLLALFAIVLRLGQLLGDSALALAFLLGPPLLVAMGYLVWSRRPAIERRRPGRRPGHRRPLAPAARPVGRRIRRAVLHQCRVSP